MINSHKYNALCYADDILLMNTTVTGLKSLIDTAVKHTTKKGLRFNPLKTERFIAGKNPFVVTPKWFIGDTSLVVKDSIKYLGTTLGNERGLFKHELLIQIKPSTAFRELVSTKI